ncbi:response regulator [Cyanobacteria bacterium FACHB-502]|nr:response regulator [Cyanobacteria bacterium FACHB-502]MBD2027288.1 response regulator [Leptolyngbya sp. FACHB-711]
MCVLSTSVVLNPFAVKIFPAMWSLTGLRSGLRVLVVDSNADSRDLLIILFEEYGVEAIAADCVSEALKIMQHNPPDLVISELALPREDGYSLIRHIKALELAHNLHIPTIALTGCTTANNRIQSLAAGFCKHLSKPVNLDELIAAVACVTNFGQAVTAYQ